MCILLDHLRFLWFDNEVFPNGKARARYYFGRNHTILAFISFLLAFLIRDTFFFHITFIINFFLYLFKVSLPDHSFLDCTNILLLDLIILISLHYLIIFFLLFNDHSFNIWWRWCFDRSRWSIGITKYNTAILIIYCFISLWTT